ncbi:MAG: sigma-70 family RNA polymerase sigma factor [Candidatus Enteromonas sp.]|nr:sigma-70 family RNA polymerase sigma factor [Candidatus Enteromonas sp.]
MNVSKLTATKFVQGDEKATNEVYLKYRSLLYFIISTYVNSKEDCEDVYQDLFVSVLENRNQIKDPSKLHSYLCISAKNKAINYAKAKNTSSNELLDENLVGEKDHTRLEDLLSFDLTHDERVVIGYRLCFGFSFKEISELTSVPVITLKTRYARAIKKTRGALK